MRHAFVQLWLAPRDICALVATAQARDDLRRYLATSGGFAGSPLQGIAALRSVYKQHFSDCVAAQSPEELDLHHLVTIPRAAYHVLRHLDFCVFYDEDGNRRTLRDEAGRPVCAPTTHAGSPTMSHPLMKSEPAHMPASQAPRSRFNIPTPASKTSPNTSHKPGPQTSQVPHSRFNPPTPVDRVGPTEASVPTTTRLGGDRTGPLGPISGGGALLADTDAYGRPLSRAREDPDEELKKLRAHMQEIMKTLSEQRAKITGEKKAVKKLEDLIAAEKTKIDSSAEAQQNLAKLQQDIVQMEEKLHKLQSKVLSAEEVRNLEHNIEVQSTDLHAHMAMEQALRGPISALEEQQKRAVAAYERHRSFVENMKNLRKRGSFWRWSKRTAS